MTRDLVVDLDGDRYAAIDYGGTGPDVLLVHQLASNAQVWAPVADDLTRLGHVIALDLRSHGLSRAAGGGAVGADAAGTDADAADPRRIATDIAPIAAELGLTRPVVLVEQDEILALAPDRLASLEAPVIGVLAISSCRRGEEARTEWAEQVGLETLDVWDERFGLFATGTPQEREPYLDRIVARANDDWVADRIDPDQYRRFYERQIEDTEEGWRRLPGRSAMEDALRVIETQPHGLDLLDDVPGPVWVLASDEASTDVEIDVLREYVADRDDRELRVIPGGPKVEALQSDAFAAAVAEMIRRHVG